MVRLKAAGGHVSLTVDSVMNILALATHEHTITQIIDFPASMPASDVSAWAKAASKPTYSWNEINNKPDVFTPDTHDHYVADILNFPTSLPASDVYAISIPYGSIKSFRSGSHRNDFKSFQFLMVQLKEFFASSR